MDNSTNEAKQCYKQVTSILQDLTRQIKIHHNKPKKLNIKISELQHAIHLLKDTLVVLCGTSSINEPSGIYSVE